MLGNLIYSFSLSKCVSYYLSEFLLSFIHCFFASMPFGILCKTEYNLFLVFFHFKYHKRLFLTQKSCLCYRKAKSIRLYGTFKVFKRLSCCISSRCKAQKEFSVANSNFCLLKEKQRYPSKQLIIIFDFYNKRIILVLIYNLIAFFITRLKSDEF